MYCWFFSSAERESRDFHWWEVWKVWELPFMFLKVSLQILPSSLRYEVAVCENIDSKVNSSIRKNPLKNVLCHVCVEGIIFQIWEVGGKSITLAWRESYRLLCARPMRYPTSVKFWNVLTSEWVKNGSVTFCGSWLHSCVLVGEFETFKKDSQITVVSLTSSTIS